MALNFKQLKKISKNPWSFTLDEENNPYKIKETFNTGCKILNAFCSDGDIRNGVPLGRRIMFSGESSTAKSYFINFIMKSYLEQFEDGMIVFFETEGSSVAQQAENAGLDLSRVIIEPVNIIEDLHEIFLTYITKLEEDFTKTNEKTRILFVLDSLGMLASRKEFDDKLAGNHTRDMTKAQAIKALFRTVSLKLSLLSCPLLVANHTYQNIGGYGDSQVEACGSGAAFAADVRFLLNKSQKKTGNVQTGVNIRLKVKKSRWVKENQTFEIAIDFEKGLVKNSYIVDLADKVGFLQLKDNGNTVIYNGNQHNRIVFENDIDSYICGGELDKLAELIKNNLSFGESDTDIDNLNINDIITAGVQFGLINDTPRTIIFNHNDAVHKVKKSDLKGDPTLIPEELINEIKNRLQEQKESE